MMNMTVWTLMYGGSYNELDGGQQKSVSDTQAAMTDANMDGRSVVGLNKRLAGNWSFETFAISEDKDSASRGIAMLKWATRY